MFFLSSSLIRLATITAYSCLRLAQFSYLGGGGFALIFFSDNPGIVRVDRHIARIGMSKFGVGSSIYFALMGSAKVLLLVNPRSIPVKFRFQLPMSGGAPLKSLAFIVISPF
jgi:hypothetical protein